MMQKQTKVALLAAATLVAGCGVAVAADKKYNAPPEMMIDAEKDYGVILKTNFGDIKLDLFEADAPMTVNNFVFLANDDFYDGTIFHRVIDNFMIQGGDPEGTGRGGPGYRFADETQGNPNRHEAFTLSMANAGPNTNGSQFFITDVSTPHLDGRHTVFGRVLEGKDVVQEITNVRVQPGSNRPTQDIVIEDVVVLVDGEPATRPAE